MSEVVVNGCRHAYQQLGDGPDLVFVHGLAASRAFWFAQYAVPLARRFRVTLYDLRGHGYSERTPSGYSATALAHDLSGLLDSLGIARCALVGHSYGGGVALEMACDQPRRVSRLCIMDTKVNVLQPMQRLVDSPELSPFEAEVARWSGLDWDREEQLGLKFLEALARHRLSGTPLVARESVTPFGESRGGLRTAKAWLELIETAGVREELLHSGASAQRLAGRVVMPALLMYGQHSRCLPSCAPLAGLLDGSEVETLPQAGHFFPLSHASAVRERLSRFLDQN